MLKYRPPGRRAIAVDPGGVMAYRWTMHIDAPPEKVFDALSDVEHHPDWANPSAKLKMSSVSGGPPRMGSTYRSEQVFVGKPQTAEIEIVEFDRPNRFAFSITQRKLGSTKEVRYRHTFVLTPEGGGTRLERTTASVGGNALLDAVVTPAVKADGKKSLANLKRKLEAPA
jgi:uncharacterized protein YndB with AHSA1/START domain